MTGRGPAGGDAQRAGDGEWPFLGREDELDVVMSALVAPAGPDRPGGAVVVAPAGVGKTRLLREVRRAAEAAGRRTATVIATDAASRTPYGAVLHLLPLGPATGPATARPADRAAWHASFSSALRGEDGEPTVLLVDDAQHLDRGSAALLVQLVLEGTVAPAVSVRHGERVPDAVTSLWKDGLCLRVDLQPFSPVELGRLIGAVLGGPVSERTLARLTAASDGNVLYARELVTAAVDAGALRRQGGVWVWDEHVVLAPRLVDAVWERLATLGDEERRALALVALGEPLPVDVAAQVAGGPRLGALERTGLVRVTGRGAEELVRLAHPLYGEVVLDRLGRLSRRDLLTTLADAVDAAGTDADGAVVRVATWRLDAGARTGWRTLHRAAVRANQTFDHALAVRLARAALEALDLDGDDGPGPDAPSGTDRAPRAWLVVDLARALVGCNDVEQAHTLLVGIEDEVVLSGEDQLVDAYLDTRFWASYLGLGRAAETRALLDRICGLPGDAAREERVTAYRACVALGEGRPRRALELAAPLLDSPGLPPLQHLLALETVGESLGCLGLPDRAEQVWARMREASEGADGRLSTAAAEAELQGLFVGMLDGRVDEVLPEVERLHARVEDSPDVVNRGLACLALGRCLLLAGRVRRARVVLLDAVADFRTLDLGSSLAWALAVLSRTASLTGRAEEARRWRDESREVLGPAGTARLEADLVAAEVWLSVAEGDRTRAAGLALEGAERYPEMDLPRAWLLHLAARAGDRSAHVVRTLREIAARVGCDGPALLADHAEALRAGDRHALEDVAERFAARGLQPLAVEAQHQAVRAHRAAGSADGVRRATARAAVLAGRLDPMPGLALLDPSPDDLAPAAALSRRELDVARLVASGLSNAAVAERLVVSVRTVESHLYQVFAKLGVRSRTELSSVLPAEDAPSAEDQWPATDPGVPRRP